MPIDDGAIIEFLRRSYFAADGLWFVQVEEEHSYSEALRLDEQVWEILPKIQARKARELLGIAGGSLADLAAGLELKFASEVYIHSTVDQTPDVLRIHVHTCPWLEVLRRAGKIVRAVEVCDRICARDFSVWASQFSEGIEFSLEKKLPDGAPACELLFTRSPAIMPLPGYPAEKEAAG